MKTHQHDRLGSGSINATPYQVRQVLLAIDRMEEKSDG